VILRQPSLKNTAAPAAPATIAWTIMLPEAASR
jgi:hypothetical protein